MTASLSTSGSTTIPRSAFSLTTSSDISLRFSGSGSGLCANFPSGLVFNSMTDFTPSAFSSWGIMIPPTELTQSTATFNCAFSIAARSTRASCNTISICLLSHERSVINPPSCPASAKIKSSSLAISRTSSPSLADRNSPFSLSSLSAFNCEGL